MITLNDAIAKGHGTERPFNCPVHDDHNASASVNVIKRVWVCYACGAKGKVDDVPIEVTINEMQAAVDALFEEKVQRIYTETWWDQFDSGPVNPYWLSRFDEETCRYFRLGYDYDHQRPCYPLRDLDGHIVGAVTRNLDGYGPKYRYPRGVKISDILFNYQSINSDTVFLVEGATDVFACHEVGLVAVASLGSTLRANQLRALVRAGVTRVILAQDQDVAGNEGAKKAESMLMQAGFITKRARWDIGMAKDIAEMSKDRRKKVLYPLVNRPLTS